MIRSRVAGRRVVHVFFAMAAVLLVSSPLRAATIGAVRTQAGLVTGVPARDPSITVYRGLPFAAAPIGTLRWRPPQPPIPWQGTRKADRFGSTCPQSGEPAAMSEDCLFLNIWSGAGSAAEKRPVFVWIYGGGFSGGAGSSAQFDGEGLARKGLVVVTFNYRLGALGFLATPDLSNESGHHASGNYGVLDQIAALQWVKANIAAFGGDPANVTIFGESAGALSVMDLMASPQAHGLFTKAISESAYMVANPDLHDSRYGLPSAESLGLATAKALKAKSLADLRAMDAVSLVNQAAGAGFIPLPTVDGWLLPDQLVEIFDHGAQAHVPLLVGSNAGELRSLRSLLPPIPKTSAEYESEVKNRFRDLGDAYLKLYPSDDVPGSVLAASRDGLYSWTAQRLAQKQTAVGQPAYLYFFAHAYPTEQASDLEAFHASEIPFVFGLIGSGEQLPVNWPTPPDTPAERALSKAMMDYWTSFARTGVPSSDSAPPWKPFGDGESYMEFRDGPTPSAHLLPGMYTLTEELIHRRRVAGNQYWFTNIGLATPPVPPPATGQK